MPAANAVSLQFAMFLGIEFLNEPNIWIRHIPTGHIGRVDTNPAVVAQFAEKIDEVSLSAADLNDFLVPYIIPVDNAFGYPCDELEKRRRKSLLVLIAFGIIVKAGVKTGVEHKTTMVADCQGYIFTFNVDGLFVVLDCSKAVNRGILYSEEIFVIAVIAIGTMHMFHFRRIVVI
jgi:hypothetical protein